jgi:Cdc6-like AAA superfamily ATPase
MDSQPERPFRNRDKEIGQIGTSVQDAAQGSRSCMINIRGVPGIGKSAMINEIAKNFSHLFPNKLEIDIEDLKATDLRGRKLEILRHIVNTLSNDHRFRKLATKVAALSEDTEENQLNSLLDQVAQTCIVTGKPWLIVADSWEYVPESVFAWFELRLLLPLVLHSYVCGIFGSQAPLKWRQFDVRRLVYEEHLQALDNKSTILQVSNDLSDTKLTELVMKITDGHPLANEIVYQHIKDQPSPRLWLKENRGYISEQVVKAILTHIVPNAHAELPRILNITALVREFDISTLRLLISVDNLDTTPPSQSTLYQIIRQLAETRLMHWNESRRSYQLDATLRHIFAQAMWSNQPEYCNSVRQAALDYYTDLIDKHPSTREQYLVEYFYQYLYKPDKLSYTEHEVQQELAAFVFRYYRDRQNQELLDKTKSVLLEQAFAKDVELQQIVVRLHLPNTIFSDIEYSVSHEIEEATDMKSSNSYSLHL